MVALFAALALSLGGCFAYLGLASIGGGLPSLGTIRCIFEFALGCSIGLAYIRFGSIIRRCYLFFGCLSIFLVLVYCATAIRDFWIFPVAFSSLILFLCFDDGLAGKLCRQRFIVFLGTISYSTYMVHMFIREVFKMLFVGDTLTPTINLLALGGVSVVFIASVVLYYTVERPTLTRLRPMPSTID